MVILLHICWIDEAVEEECFSSQVYHNLPSKTIGWHSALDILIWGGLSHSTPSHFASEYACLLQYGEAAHCLKSEEDPAIGY